MTPLRQRMIGELQLGNLSEATIQTYVRAVWRFARHFGKSPDQLGPEHVREYLLHLRNDKKDKWSTLQVNRGALKFLYARVLKQGWFDEEIPAPKKLPHPITALTPTHIPPAHACHLTASPHPPRLRPSYAGCRCRPADHSGAPGPRRYPHPRPLSPRLHQTPTSRDQSI